MAITGDIVSGQEFNGETQHGRWWLLKFKMLTDALEAADVPYAFIAGYHDFEMDLN